MKYTLFKDGHSGGGTKEKWEYILIPLPLEQAAIAFFHQFGHRYDRITCSCCGEDYDAQEGDLKLITGFYRGCKALDTPRVGHLYREPDDAWWKAHYWIEPEDEAEALSRGWTIEDRRYYKTYQTVEEFLQRKDVLVIAEPVVDEIEIPEQGWVYRD